jgi:hypothetical protein
MTVKKNSGRAWFKAQPDLDPERLVFIDETGASTKMARLRGRAQRGMRCRSPIPHGHWKTTTFTGALRLTGMTAPMVLDGPMTGEWFAAYAAQVLAPTLRPGDIVILDNLPAHKTMAAREAIEAVGRECCSCRHTAPTSIQPKMPSRSSRPSCGKPPPEPSPSYGMQFARHCPASLPKNAQITLLPPGMSQSDRILL